MSSVQQGWVPAGAALAQVPPGVRAEILVEETQLSALDALIAVREGRSEDIQYWSGRCLAFLRCMQAQRVHAATWPLVLLMVGATVADTFPERRQAADGRPLDDPAAALPVLLARAVLTAAPPASCAPVRAGAAAT